MTDLIGRQDRDLAAWLDDQPGGAPDHLLAAVVTRTRAVRQRPGPVAIALGAPTLAGPGRRTRPSARLALAALAMLAALLGLAIATGAPRSNPVLVPRSAEPTPHPTIAYPGPSARPSPTLTSPPPLRSFPPTVTASWSGLEVTVPGDWMFLPLADRLQISVRGQVSATFSPLFDIRRLPLGTQIHVARGYDAVETVIEAATFDDLVAAVEAEVPLLGPRTDYAVDGRRLVGWMTAQASIVRPLVWIGLLEDGGGVYVMTEHLPLDAAVDVSSHVTALVSGLHVTD